MAGRFIFKADSLSDCESKLLLLKISSDLGIYDVFACPGTNYFELVLMI